jgi:hypothetical protein
MGKGDVGMVDGIAYRYQDASFILSHAEADIDAD